MQDTGDDRMDDIFMGCEIEGSREEADDSIAESIIFAFFMFSFLIVENGKCHIEKSFSYQHLIIENFRCEDLWTCAS